MASTLVVSLSDVIAIRDTLFEALGGKNGIFVSKNVENGFWRKIYVILSDYVLNPLTDCANIPCKS